MTSSTLSSLSSSSHTEFPFSSPAQSTVSTPKVTQLNRGDSTMSVFGTKITKADFDQHQRDHTGFGNKRETLVQALDETTNLVKGLAAFNQEKWTIHYPHALGVSNAPVASSTPATTSITRSSTSPPSTPPRSALKGSRPEPLRRSASLFIDEAGASPERPSPATRSYSTLETPAKSSSNVNTSSTAPVHPLSILSLDLKLGHPTAPTTSLPSLLPSLSLQTLSHLLSRRLTSSLSHLTSIRTRVTDTSSRVLITGDLNSGKSTLVNALLRRELMPSDQQPCTTVFCEVVDAVEGNQGKEEVHAIREVDKYDVEDKTTYDVYSLEEVNELQDPTIERDGGAYSLLKAYVVDSRAPKEEEDDTSEQDPMGSLNPSFIRHPLASISLIDAPGLNVDTLSTTALFTRQSEIDVIVFVVSAENHFTLSAKEFLWNASREKKFVFVVVNKWEGIRDKKRCERTVGEQIRQLSPATWEQRGELVHFVDAVDWEDLPEEKEMDDNDQQQQEKEPSSWIHLEQSLRSFVLLRRTTSKLAPARTYLLNLLSDLSTLAQTNVVAASDELKKALEVLEVVRPVHERLVKAREGVEREVDGVEESVVEGVKGRSLGRLEEAVEKVEGGEVATTTTTTSEGGEGLPEWRGVWELFEWAEEVKCALVRSLESVVRECEEDARIETTKGVERVLGEMGERFLGVDEGKTKEQKEEEKRVFRPEVMFAKRRRGAGRLAMKGLSSGLGLGTAGGYQQQQQQDDNLEVDLTFLDLFDVDRFLSLVPGHQSSSRKSLTNGSDHELVETSTILGLGLGSLGMVGSRVIGVKGTLDSITKFVEMLGSPAAKKWAGPVLGLCTVGLVTYLILDLPRAIPRNIGRRLALSLSPPSTTPSSPASLNTFQSLHADRISRESRKVLRLAGWDLRERFRAALLKAEVERKEVEARVEKSEKALEWLDVFGEKVEKEEKRVGEVEV